MKYKNLNISHKFKTTLWPYLQHVQAAIFEKPFSVGGYLLKSQKLLDELAFE